jgi:replicative DNA helicase
VAVSIERVPGDVTWRTEFYFCCSLIKNPRFVPSIESPQRLFANKDTFSIFRMIEQAVHRRGSGDPLSSRVGLDELMSTPEAKTATHVDLRGLWHDLDDPAISGAPERYNNLLECYDALRSIDRRVTGHINDVRSGEMDPEDAIHRLQSDVVGVHSLSSYEPETVQSMIETVWIGRDSRPTVTIRTGFRELDRVIGALVPGCTYVWAARTSHGKSSWAAQIVNQQAMAGHSVGVIAMEDSKSVWATRWMSRISGVTLPRIRENILSAPLPVEEGGLSPLSAKEEAALAATVCTDHLKNVMFSDAKGARLMDVIRIMNDMAVRGCSTIWIDYIQAIYAPSGDNRSRRDWLEYCWAKLEREAETLNVPLCLLAQLNRQWEQDPLPSMPGLRHIEWLGAAEQKAYVGGVIYRPFRDPRLKREEQDRRFNELIVNIEKSKQGESVALNYRFDPSRCVIEEECRS